MAQPVLDFYESLASHYHLIFENWDKAIERQAAVLGPLIDPTQSTHPLRILDCACGIGTQAIGFARLGHHVVASDISPAEVARAQREAALRSLDIRARVSDMTSLQEITESDFDVVAALDNALPHLDATQLQSALQAIASKLGSNGLFLASIRDYNKIIGEEPAIQPPAFFGKEGNRRIVHQVWDWVDETSYALHLYITTQTPDGWETRHFTSRYNRLLREDLSALLKSAGFRDVQWLMPAESGYYQPLVLARKQS